MNTRNKKMNGFQIFAGILYGIAIFGSMTIITNGDDFSVTTGTIAIISSSILFYFMYALGEIVKQLRISNEMFYDNEEK